METRWSGIDKKRVDEVYDEIHKHPFPKPRYSKNLQASRIRSFHSYAQKNKGNIIQGDLIRRTNYGSKVVTPYHPHRYNERTTEMTSVRETWEKNPTKLKRAILMTIANGHEPTLKNVHRSFMQYKMGRSPAFFFPAQSTGVIHKYSKEGDTVLDPFTGYGGSIPAAAALNRKFVGIDISKKSIKGNERMIRDIRKVTGARKNQFRLIHGDTRHAMNHKIKPGSVDMVYTSPPYFNRELYSGKGQSHQIKNYQTWLRDFYTPSLDGMNRVTKKGGYVVINVAPVKKNGKVKYPLDKHTLELASSLGFKHIETKRLHLGEVRRGVTGIPMSERKTEPVHVFKKVGKSNIAEAQKKADIISKDIK